MRPSRQGELLTTEDVVRLDRLAFFFLILDSIAHFHAFATAPSFRADI